MLFAIVSVIIIVALLLVLVILAQNSKGGGLSSQFGGSGTSQIIGVKKTGDLLEKITWGLAIALMALSISTTFVIDSNPGSGPISPNVERAREQNILPNMTNPLENAGESEGIEGSEPAGEVEQPLIETQETPSTEDTQE